MSHPGTSIALLRAQGLHLRRCQLKCILYLCDRLWYSSQKQALLPLYSQSLPSLIGKVFYSAHSNRLTMRTNFLVKFPTLGRTSLIKCPTSAPPPPPPPRAKLDRYISQCKSMPVSQCKSMPVSPCKSMQSAHASQCNQPMQINASQ